MTVNRQRTWMISSTNCPQNKKPPDAQESTTRSKQRLLLTSTPLGSLRPEAIKTVSKWAISYRRFWEESFDKLDVVVNQMKKEGGQR